MYGIPPHVQNHDFKKMDPPNLVAKLMGMDALPQHEPLSTTQGSHSRIHLRGSFDNPTNKYVHERWQQPPKSLHKGRYELEAMNDRKMNLVRQKFIEAKHLSMDEKLRQSKQFQDALDVLNSNKDLFLKCLQEPNSTQAQLYSLQPPPETKRITVLRPSNVTNANGNNSAGARYRDNQQIKVGSPDASLKCDGNSPQPTKIVVLKPSPEKPQNHGKAMSTPKLDPPNILLGEYFLGEVEDDESREMAKEITQQVRERLGKQQRCESLFSSVFSNGYVGDESSFNKSELEVMSPVSRRSWDYADRLSSPHSSSLYTRASYSPESSVCREAKKRLSERWKAMASGGFYQEQILFQRSPSTLGDMLALSDTNKEASPREEHLDYSAINLMRSKSVPVPSTTEFETTVNVELGFSKDDTKERSFKSSSFREKVSGLFFSRNKKPGINKSVLYGTKVENHSIHGEFFYEKGSGHASPDLMSPETGLAVEERIAPGDTCENQDQYSPISAFDPPLEENEHTAKLLPHYGTVGPNLIDKSPPIGSIVRTLSRDNSCITKSASHPTREALSSHKEDEDQECFFFIKTLLLSVASLQGEAQSDSSLAKWHSPESPLDPSLRDNGKHQHPKRSTQKLIFDCINEVLIDIAGYEQSGKRVVGPDSCALDEVWARMKAWFPSRDECGLVNDSDLVAERVVREEMMGEGWNCHRFTSEMEDWRTEIVGKFLEELVVEMVVELTCGDS